MRKGTRCKFIPKKEEKPNYDSNFMERIPRVNQLIKKELSQIVLKKFDFPADILVTITRVEASGNLIHARVYISVLPEEKTPQIFKILNQRIYDIQQLLNRRLRMRPIPKINFVEEKQTAQAGKIEELLEKISAYRQAGKTKEND